MSKPILYTYYRSSCSWRLRICLAYKEIDYESRFVNLVKSEQLNPEEFKKLNPMGQVPVLVVNGHTLAQSIPIMEYLEEQYPEKPIFPKDPFARAKVREICEIIGSGIQPIQNLAVLLEYSDIPAKRIEWAHLWITKGFDALEKVLSESSGTYCFGDEVTMADILLVPQIHNAERYEVDMNRYPIITRISSALGNLDAFKVAQAFVQPDCPPELRI